MDGTGKEVEFSFESGGLSAPEVERVTANMWADLPFDREAIGALKRDGLVLDGVHLGGPMPYRFEPAGDDRIVVIVAGADGQTLLDLWQIHFRRGLRPRNLAA